ncbi:hypothetical protein BN946_scf184580.g2, partial [Trametes cinnabarina]
RPSQSQAQRIASPPRLHFDRPPRPRRRRPRIATYFQPPSGAPPVPSVPATQPAYADPFLDPIAAMPNPYERSGTQSGTRAGHAAEPTDATFYTATGSDGGVHSRDVSEDSPYAVSAYDSGSNVARSGAGAGALGHGPPPAYSAAPP